MTWYNGKTGGTSPRVWPRLACVKGFKHWNSYLDLKPMIKKYEWLTNLLVVDQLTNSLSSKTQTSLLLYTRFINGNDKADFLFMI